MQDLVAALRGQGLQEAQIHLFSGDGTDPAPDLPVRSKGPVGAWLLEGTSVGQALAVAS